MSLTALEHELLSSVMADVDNMSPDLQSGFAEAKDALSPNVDLIFRRQKHSLKATGHSYTEWANKRPSRDGFSFEQRFDFWASTKYGACMFIDVYVGDVIFPVVREGDKVVGVTLAYGTATNRHITHLMPIFWRRGVFPTALNQAIQHLANNLEKRKESLKKSLKQEPISELDTWGDYSLDNSRAFSEPVPKQHDKPEAQRGEPNVAKVKDTKHMSNHALHVEKSLEKAEKPMSKKDNFVNTQKEVFAEVVALQAGRASNKAVKEAMRPLIKAAFKPTFMQRVAMKLFKIQDPTEKLLESPASDLVCAQLVQLLLDVRGVENEKVRTVAKGAIVYSANELANKVPFEEAVDSVIKKLEASADKIVK